MAPSEGPSKRFSERAGPLFVDFREKTLNFNHGFNDRGFPMGNGTSGSESSV